MARRSIDTRFFITVTNRNRRLFNSRDLTPGREKPAIVAPTDDPTGLLCFLIFSLTSVAGVSRVIAVVARDPQDPVLYVVHPVGCHFGAAVHEDGATGRRSLARQVCVLQGLQPDARLVPALQDTLGACHFRSKRAEIERHRGQALITMRETPGAASTISRREEEEEEEEEEEDIHIHIHIPSVMLPDAEQGYQTPGAWQTSNTRGRATTITCFSI